MSEAASAERSTAAKHTANDIQEQQSAVAVQRVWRRNLQTGAETARAIQTENAQFAGRLLGLASTPFAGPMEFGASAMELYFGYLGRCAALSQQAIVLPWREDGRPNARGRR